MARSALDRTGGVAVVGAVVTALSIGAHGTHTGARVHNHPAAVDATG